jgi:drug/metabolite transporter (DMT)-like permease
MRNVARRSSQNWRVIATILGCFIDEANAFVIPEINRATTLKLLLPRKQLPSTRIKASLYESESKDNNVNVDSERRNSVAESADVALEIHPVAPENSINVPSAVADVPLSSVVLLNLVAVLWGSQHAVIKLILIDHTTTDPGLFTLLRFGLAAVLASPYTPGFFNGRQSDKEADERSHQNTIWRWGLEMGFWMFLGFAFQAVGLEYTTAQKSGFLLYLNVKFVPLLARILYGREITAVTWVSALTAFTGTALLATSGGGGASEFNVGDVWSIAAAVSSAMFILRLEKASLQVSNAASLNASCLWVVTIFAAIWTILPSTIGHSSIDTLPLTTQMSGMISEHGWQLLYLSVVTTALANWIQTKAQRDV